MNFRLSSLVALVIFSVAAPTAVLADKGWKPGRGHEKKQEESIDDRRDDRRDDGRVSVEFRFGEQERRVVRDYYGEEVRGGRCPPGLAKKGNGCMPPGQAKKWATGRPLPRDLRYEDLPRDLVLRLPPPPSGHRYVRIAGDVLLIAVGSAMVVDAIQDILR